MTNEELKSDAATRTALLNQLNQLGMHPLPDSEHAILAWFTGKGAACSAQPGYLVVTQADGSPVVPSSACETLRRERPELFAADAKRDKVSSRQDLERGSASEIFKAKSDYIKEHGVEMWERLPATKVSAEKRSAPVSLDMTRDEYKQLSFREKARLAGVVGPNGIGKIMNRK
jgi:hypothetical protein